jgi:UDPglucose 6-dehydrogenase
MATIGIIGNGYVGRATALLGKPFTVYSSENRVFIYDINPELCSHEGISMRDLVEDCDFIFVCVPTPMNPDGSCSSYEVTKVIISLQDMGFASERIIVKSTVPVGTCEEAGVSFMPEFLTEANWEEDFVNQSNWILGTNARNDQMRDELYSVFVSAHNEGALSNPPTIHFLTTKEAELVKYVRNCFLATKVSFFNEIYDFCAFHKINYEKVREITVLDDRIEESHTKVPGPDGKRGFGGTCFPKDMSAFRSQLKKVSSLLGFDHGVINACIQRNNKLDRPEKDWEENKGRSVL